MDLNYRMLGFVDRDGEHLVEVLLSASVARVFTGADGLTDALVPN
ncbi:hypothetical protein RX329_36555 [Bradyrhizobium sp. BWC-3-1]|nr:hypothetical protein [Bradyrhizobium sp. BWC-3-1]WOH62843.1 hypothetical protein RX329_36555 [Bradyrhizobium sp. BWC-3-1]